MCLPLQIRASLIVNGLLKLNYFPAYYIISSQKPKNLLLALLLT